MISVHGTYQNGVVVLDAPAKLPEGAHVCVTLDPEEYRSDGRPWPKTPEEIAAFVAEMDATPALEMTDEEIARWEATRREERESQKAMFDKWADKTGRLFD